METMKDSGVQWIGEIPSTWKTTKIKYTAIGDECLFLDGDWIESDVIEDEGIRYFTTGNVGAGSFKKQGNGYISKKTFNELHCLKVYPGDLMISRLNEPIGRACLIPESDREEYYVVAVDNVILRPNLEFNKRYLVYVMNCTGYAEHANLIARGATMHRISRSQLGQFFIPVPTVCEQETIADFLDNQCGKLDSIIADLEKQIDTLKAYKKSLITETVTKGINKSVPMKDSGVEWIGTIPEHWHTKRLKYLGTARNGLTYDPADIDETETGTLVLRSSNIQNEELSLEDTLYVKNMQIPKEIRLQEDDILLCSRNGSRSLIGKCIPIDKRTIGETYGAFMCVFRSEHNKFLHYVFLSELFNYYLPTFLTSTVNQLTNQNLYNMVVPITFDKNEQNDIVNFLDKQCAFIDEVIHTKTIELETVKSHKNSLIFEYVTGKKRVKEVQ